MVQKQEKKGARITKSMWNALPDKDKRQHRDGSTHIRVKTISADGTTVERWERCYWLS